jgi:hypothetical protein
VGGGFGVAGPELSLEREANKEHTSVWLRGKWVHSGRSPKAVIRPLNFGNFQTQMERETMTENRSNEEMLGEVLREIGVLIVVFFPFDEWISFHALTWKFALLSVCLSAVCIIGGMWLERNRER